MVQSEDWYKAKVAEFEAEGEESVRDKLARGVYAGNNGSAAQRWVDSLEAARSSAIERRRDAVSEEHLSQAQLANEIASRAVAQAKTANKIAAIAMVMAIISGLISIVTAFSSR